MMAHVEMGPGDAAAAAAAAAAAPVIKLFGAVIHDRPPKEEEEEDDDDDAAATVAAAHPPPPPPPPPPSSSAESCGGAAAAGAAAAAAAGGSAPLPCPRCRSRETKFCYFNNYNVNQPRHFCKSCRRYWTAGGALRNVPVGAGRRKARPIPLPLHHPHSLHHPLPPSAAADRWIPRPDPAAAAVRPGSAAAAPRFA